MKNISSNWEQDFNQWIESGTSQSTRRAYIRDVIYYWHWINAQYKEEEHYPASPERIIQFCLFHIDPNSPQPLKLSTIRRYLSSLSIRHKELGVHNPITHPQVKLLLRRAKAAKQEQPNKKSAITLDILEALINTCDDSITGLRDKTILLVGFAAGGRRRSEIANLCVEDLEQVENGYILTIKKSKTDQFGKGHRVPVYGRAATALKAWIIKSGIRKGHIFRGIKSNNSLYEKISPRTINLIVKRRIEIMGLNPGHFGAHSLRAGFLTESSHQGINLTEAMMLSGHKSIKVAQGYCQDNYFQNNKASQLI